VQYVYDQVYARKYTVNITDAESETIPSCSSPDDYNTFMKAVAALYKNGVEFNFQKLVPENRKHTDIPRYKFYRSGTPRKRGLTKCKETDVSEIGIEEADFETARPISACIAPGAIFTSKNWFQKTENTQISHDINFIDQELSSPRIQ
jgi:hypothetical protein